MGYTGSSRRNQQVKTKVERDAEGLFITIKGHKFRPGSVEGYDNRFDMREGSLKEGNVVHTTSDHFNDTQDLRRYTREHNLRKLSTKEGAVYWHAEGEIRNKGLREHPQDGVYDREGRRSLFVDEDQKGLFVAVPHSTYHTRPRNAVREKHRISALDAARFSKGQPVDLYWKRGMLGGETASIIARDTGEAATLKFDKRPDAPATLVERAQQNMLAMAASLGR